MQNVATYAPIIMKFEAQSETNKETPKKSNSKESKENNLWSKHAPKNFRNANALKAKWVRRETKKTNLKAWQTFENKNHKRTTTYAKGIIIQAN